MNKRLAGTRAAREEDLEERKRFGKSCPTCGVAPDVGCAAWCERWAKDRILSIADIAADPADDLHEGAVRAQRIMSLLRRDGIAPDNVTLAALMLMVGALREMLDPTVWLK